MSLLNVRLGPEDARRAASLRRAGVAISTLVREALRAEYERRVAGKQEGKRPSAIVAAVLTEIPDPDAEPLGFSLTDRRAVRDHIRAKLRARRK